MPLPVQGTGASAPLTDAYGLMGKLGLKMDETIVPVSVVGDLGDEVVWGPRCMGCCVMPGGGAANNSKFEIRFLGLPTSRVGVAALIEHVSVKMRAVPTEVHVLPSPGPIVATHTGLTAWADTRSRGLPQVGIFGNNNTVPAGVAGVVRRYLEINEYASLVSNWIIGPDPDTGVLQGLYVETSGLNAITYCVVAWRERLPR